MAQTYKFLWTRFQSDLSPDKYFPISLPKPLQLEGNGIQYVYAIPEHRFEQVSRDLRLDGHEVRSLLCDQALIHADGNQSKFQVCVKYDTNKEGKFETKYYLKKLE